MKVEKQIFTLAEASLSLRGGRGLVTSQDRSATAGDHVVPFGAKNTPVMFLQQKLEGSRVNMHSVKRSFTDKSNIFVKSIK